MLKKISLLLIISLLAGWLLSACAAVQVAPQSTATAQPPLSTSTLPAPDTTPTPQPTVITPTPTTGNALTVTLQDQGKTVQLAVGETFLLQLGEDYTWDIQVADTGILGRVVNITVVRGAQGVYQALKSGTTTLTAAGDPVCRQAKPPCGRPSIQFSLTIEVK